MSSDVIFFIAIFTVLCLVFAVFGTLLYVLNLWGNTMDEIDQKSREADNE